MKFVKKYTKLASIVTRFGFREIDLVRQKTCHDWKE